MVDTCHVTGVVISPDGDPVPRATVRFQRLPHEVFVEDDKTGIPREVRAEADEEGNIAVDLIPGEYKAIIIARGYNQYPAFNVGVPDQPTAVLADIQDAVPPPSLDDATRAVRDAREARDEARDAVQSIAEYADTAEGAAEAALAATTVSYGVSIYHDNGVEEGAYYAERRAAAESEHTSVYIEVIDGHLASEVQVSLEVNEAVVYGPVTVASEEPHLSEGLSILVPAGASVNWAILSVVGTVKEVFARSYGRLT